MASLAGIVAALVFMSGGSAPLAVGAALVAGLAGGVVNGALVAYVGILPFIATLGAMTVFSGLAFKLSGGQTLFGDAIPHGFSDFARGGVPLFSTGLVIPDLTLIAGATVVAAWILLEQTVVGRRLYAIGGNAEAARGSQACRCVLCVSPRLESRVSARPARALCMQAAWPRPIRLTAPD